MRSQDFCKLQKLTLSKIGLDRTAILPLSEVVNNTVTLYSLDISSNLLDVYSLTFFISKITYQNSLRYLNLAYNNANYNFKDKYLELTPQSFEFSLAHMLHQSKDLLHLDLSGLQMAMNQIKYIVSDGLTKSRSLLAVHLGGYTFDNTDRYEMRQSLKIKDDRIRYQPNMHDRYRHNNCNIEVSNTEMSQIIGKTQFNTIRALFQLVNKNNTNYQ